MKKAPSEERERTAEAEIKIDNGMIHVCVSVRVLVSVELRSLVKKKKKFFFRETNRFCMQMYDNRRRKPTAQ